MEEVNADYGGLVQPSQQDVAPCVKGVEWGLDTRGLKVHTIILCGGKIIFYFCITEISFLNLVELNEILIVIKLFYLVPKRSKKSNYVPHLF